MSFKKSLISLIAAAVILNGAGCRKSIVWHIVNSVETKKAEKQLENYASDGQLDSGEISNVLSIANNEKINKEINSIKSKLEKRLKDHAKIYYGYAKESSGKGEYGRALAHIDSAIQCDPSNLKYAAYKSYLEIKSTLEEAKIERRAESERRESNNSIMRSLGGNVRRILER